jgi:hypothetical protein
MNTLLLAAVGALAMALPSKAVMIDLFEVNSPGSPYFYHALISWAPGTPQATSAGAEVVDDPPDILVGGIAFLSVTASAGRFDFITAPTDTNGDYSPEAVDYFSLPVSQDAPFPLALEGALIASHFYAGYQVSRHPGTINGLRLSVSRPTVDVPESGSTLGIFTMALGACLLRARCQGRPNLLPSPRPKSPTLQSQGPRAGEDPRRCDWRWS